MLQIKNFDGAQVVSNGNIITDIDFPEDEIMKRCQLCTQHKLDVYFDSLIFISHCEFNPTITNCKITIEVDEENRDLPQGYDVKISKKEKSRIIANFIKEFALQEVS